jgi:hypothetical protein
VVTEQESGFAGLVVVLVFMKAAAEIARPGLGEQDLTAHLWGFYTNGWRLTLASNEVTYPSLVPETGKPLGDQGQLNQRAVKKRFQHEHDQGPVLHPPRSVNNWRGGKKSETPISICIVTDLSQTLTK